MIPTDKWFRPFHNPTQFDLEELDAELLPPPAPRKKTQDDLRWEAAARSVGKDPSDASHPPPSQKTARAVSTAAFSSALPLIPLRSSTRVVPILGETLCDALLWEQAMRENPRPTSLESVAQVSPPNGNFEGEEVLPALLELSDFTTTGKGSSGLLDLGPSIEELELQLAALELAAVEQRLLADATEPLSSPPPSLRPSSRKKSPNPSVETLRRDLAAIRQQLATANPFSRDSVEEIHLPEQPSHPRRFRGSQPGTRSAIDDLFDEVESTAYKNTAEGHALLNSAQRSTDSTTHLMQIREADAKALEARKEVEFLRALIEQEKKNPARTRSSSASADPTGQQRPQETPPPEDRSRETASLRPAVLTQNPSNDPLIPRTAQLTWGAYTYTITQELPASVTQDDWLAMVNAYESLLNKPTIGVRPGVQKLQLDFDTAKGSISISNYGDKPETSTPISIGSAENEIVGRLINYATTRERNTLDGYRWQLPPLGLPNPSKRLCYLNALMQMIEYSPHMRDLVMAGDIHSRYRTSQKDNEKISRLNIPGLEGHLFSEEEQKRQQDPLEALGRLMTLTSEQPNKLLAERVTHHYYKAIQTDTAGIQQLVDEHKLLRHNTDPTLFLKEIRRMDLPVLSLTPAGSGTTKMDEAILQQLATPKKPRGDTETLTSQDGTAALALQEETEHFTTAPPTLLFHATRHAESSSKDKNTGKIELTDTVLIPGTLVSPRSDVRYKLQSFIVHTSHERTDGTQTANDGHYIAYVTTKEKDGKIHYYEIDDENVRAIEKEEFFEKAQNFYLASYDKIEEERPSADSTRRHAESNEADTETTTRTQIPQPPRSPTTRRDLPPRPKRTVRTPNPRNVVGATERVPSGRDSVLEVLPSDSDDDAAPIRRPREIPTTTRRSAADIDD